MKHSILPIYICSMLMSCGAETNPSTEPENLGIIKPGPEFSHADSMNIDFQLRGNCYAYSSDKNAIPTNGEAHSDNLPRNASKVFHKNDFFLLINQNEFTVIDSSVLGCKLYLVNTTGDKKELQASDSRLYIIAEALNDKNEWVPITYLPGSGCGNSYHTVILDKDEYWEFDIPVFKGNIKTKLRYSLLMDEKKISSNEIIAYLNDGQFNPENKQGHRPQNIMDPYSD